MNEVRCLVRETGKVFSKWFDSLYQQRIFMLRCRHSNKIKIIGYTYLDNEEYEYLEFGR